MTFFSDFTGDDFDVLHEVLRSLIGNVQNPLVFPVNSLLLMQTNNYSLQLCFFAALTIFVSILALIKQFLSYFREEDLCAISPSFQISPPSRK